LASELIDKNGDGHFDEEITYNSYGMQTKIIELND